MRVAVPFPRAPEARRLAGACAVLVTLGLGACSPVRGVESWDLLNDVAAGPAPSRLKRIAPDPLRRPIAFHVEDRSYRGDLYRPGETAEAALVLVPGAVAGGKDDPRLVAFATTLARARFAVLVPDIETLRRLELGPSDVRAIADALRHAAGAAPGWTGRGERAPLGLVAFSYAAGPAILAALTPQMHGRLRFLLAIGGYHDIEAVVTFFTTGRFRTHAEAPWQQMTPNAYGKWLFLRANAQRVGARRDRDLLAAMAERKLKRPEAGIEDLAAALGPEGRAVHALLANRDPDAVPGLIGALPAAIRSDLAALDLARHDLSRLEPELILIHGRDDAIIPYSESLALAAAAPRGRVSLTLVNNLAHVDLGPGGLLDGLRLWRAVYRLLELRDRL